MIDTFQAYLSSTELSGGTIAMIGIGLGSMLFVFGLSGAMAGKNPVLRRMSGQQAGRRRATVAENGILRHANNDPTGFFKALIPNDTKERTDVQRQLSMAGLTGPHAVRNYYLLRMFLGMVLPFALLTLVWVSRTGTFVLPPFIDDRISGWSQLRVLQILVFSVAAGFYGPAIWLRSRASDRRREIEEHFPNALDLIQISVEAGLGFDAAMIRVGNELENTAPAISQELLTAQREIQAGRGRDRALLDMAARTGVEEVASFANVVLQSMQFGTSVSETLTTYASEMRVTRELRAQEKANKLPVHMSAVMASLMLPALLLLTLGPVVIRYIRFFAG
ncbi:MAG: type II secretion system F family protein [Marinosulfonomonas sp.]|nr:type II secretion system F family protein [Marinosulfonomonas sp.]